VFSIRKVAPGAVAIAVNTLKTSLAHVLWIGGATDSGKTSVARALAEKYGLQAYHYDLYDREVYPGHWAGADPARQPHMHATPTEDRNWMWVDTTPQELVQRWLETTPERFELTVEDLQALPSRPPIVAEGYGLSPELVQPLLTSPRQAIWLVSTETFKRATYERRGKGQFAGTRDPARARYNHIERDLLLAEYMRERAKELGLTVVEIDGNRSLDAVVALVTRHFGPFLPAAPKDL
jgi:2-phosphoglycerate kinase